VHQVGFFTPLHRDTRSTKRKIYKTQLMFILITNITNERKSK